MHSYKKLQVLDKLKETTLPAYLGRKDLSNGVRQLFKGFFTLILLFQKIVLRSKVFNKIQKYKKSRKLCTPLWRRVSRKSSRRISAR